MAVGACAEAENNCCSDIKSEVNKAQEESYVEVRDAEFSVLGVGGGGGGEGRRESSGSVSVDGRPSFQGGDGNGWRMP